VRWWLTALALFPALALGQVVGADVQKRANAVLAMMGYMLTPDVTTGALAIANDTTGNPDFKMSTIGGGFTAEGRQPLYLEGTAGYARYDPTFSASGGAGQGSIAAKWDAYSLTGGIGWSFPIARDLALRPIFNVSYGRVVSRASGSGQVNGADVSFLRDGQLDAYGVGGSLVLDYEHYRREGDIDVELRYTNIALHSFGGSSDAVKGHADAQSLSFWSRWRAPTGAALLERPLRYVLEFASTSFLGDLKGVLGFDHMSSLGTGLELDTSKYDTLVTRARLMGRYHFGEHVRGWSVGLAVDF
jgi:hypothetical protein